MDGLEPTTTATLPDEPGVAAADSGSFTGGSAGVGSVAIVTVPPVGVVGAAVVGVAAGADAVAVVVV
ncbi:MAG TPA: hypothetical protein VG652_12695, partial [Gaiellaceae bacterium]|nr:hypothetical protein [Gaiellaceae bacterium]